MKSVTNFSIEEIQQFRQRVEEVSRVPRKGPEGWSKSKVDPMKILSLFSTIHLKKGFVLHAYQFRSGGNGNGVVWAMPKGLGFPPPQKCQKLEDRFLKPPKPQGALDNIMEAIEGDGTPKSYILASIFTREIAEFGAVWHGCSWSIHVILGSDPWNSSQNSTLRNSLDGHFNKQSEWEWLELKPLDWRPEVCEDNNIVTVSFIPTAD